MKARKHIFSPLRRNEVRFLYRDWKGEAGTFTIYIDINTKERIKDFFTTFLILVLVDKNLMKLKSAKRRKK